MKLAGILTVTVILPLFFTISDQSPPSPSPPPPHFIKSNTKHSTNDTTPQQYFEVTHPLPTDDVAPACSVSLLNHSFGNTYGSRPVTVDYTPPPATCEWSTAVLEFRAECKGEQYDRIAGVWVAGVELLRTSTAQPTEDGVFWKVRKDVSRYSSVISQSNVALTVMLENLVNDEFTGVYHVNISMLYYSDASVRVPLSIVHGESEPRSLNRKLISDKNNQIGDKLYRNRVFKSLYPYDTPADLVVPISASGGVNEGFWFRIENEFDVQTKIVQISNKTHKAVLELYVSFHGDDEFWYMNPSDLYVETNNLTTGRAHGAYREVLVTIDGKLVGGVVPFPVIFTGGINPLFWEPVVSIGAFNLPSYDIDFTLFLGLLLDNKNHSIGIRIADGISFWLVDANLHLWFDQSDVQAQTLKSNVPSMEIERQDEFMLLDGEFEIKGERNSEVTGLVHSSTGNLQIQFTEKMKFKNKLKFKDEGTTKEVNQQYKRKTKMKITDEMGRLIESLEVKVNYPLKISTETKPGSDTDTSVMTTKVQQERNAWVYGGEDSMVLRHKQNCTGLMVVKGHSVLSGSAENQQSYNYNDDSGCYSRMVDVVDGDVVGDDTSSICVGPGGDAWLPTPSRDLSSNHGAFDEARLKRQMVGVNDSILYTTRVEEGKPMDIVVSSPGLEKTECEEGLCVTLNMPELAKEDVDVSARVDTNDHLLIRAKTHDKIYLAGMKLPPNYFTKTSNDKLKGEMKNGVLKLTLPAVKLYKDLTMKKFMAKFIANRIIRIFGSFTMYKKETIEGWYVSANLPALENIKLIPREDRLCIYFMCGVEIEGMVLIYKNDTLFIEGKSEREHYIAGIRIPKGLYKNKHNMIKVDMQNGLCSATLFYATKEEEIEKKKGRKFHIK